MQVGVQVLFVRAFDHKFSHHEKRQKWKFSRNSVIETENRHRQNIFHNITKCADMRGMPAYPKSAPLIGLYGKDMGLCATVWAYSPIRFHTIPYNSLTVPYPSHTAFSSAVCRLISVASGHMVLVQGKTMIAKQPSTGIGM